MPSDATIGHSAFRGRHGHQTRAGAQSGLGRESGCACLPHRPGQNQYMAITPFMGVGLARPRQPCKVLAAGQIQEEFRIAFQRLGRRSDLPDDPFPHMLTRGWKDMRDLRRRESDGEIRAHVLADQFTGVG